MKTIRDFNLEGKKVIIRVDFNVPIKEGKIVDDKLYGRGSIDMKGQLSVVISLLKNTTFSQIDNIFKKRYTEKEKSMLFDYPLIKKIEVKKNEQF